MRQFLSATLMAALTLGPLVEANAAPTGHSATSSVVGQPATPIKHLVIIFQENVSFDHYFGTYPNAPNPPGRTEVLRRCPARRRSTAIRRRC